jgi:hypothetical protein
MPALFANLAASKSWHISSQKIAQLRFKGEKLCRYLIFFVWTAGNPVNFLLPVQRINRSAIHAEVLI